MGDDIKTSRSTCSDYWAALCWLSKNQNKWPYATDPHWCHHPLITQLRMRVSLLKTGKFHKQYESWNEANRQTYKQETKQKKWKSFICAKHFLKKSSIPVKSLNPKAFNCKSVLIPITQRKTLSSSLFSVCHLSIVVHFRHEMSKLEGHWQPCSGRLKYW